MYRLVLKGETLRPRDPVHLCVTPVMYNSMGLRFVVDQPLNKLVFIGMIYEDLDELKNRQKRRQESTENQLKAIADPTRLSIMRMLSQRPHYVQELADALGLSPATLSHHLKVLLQAMLVGTGIEGRRSYYSLNAEELSGLAADLQAMADAAMEENK
jgi:DNA-binding transcriptional ArsR family regulator